MIKADRAEAEPERCPEISEGGDWTEEMEKMAGSENVRVEMDMKDVNDNQYEMNSFEQRVAKLDAEIEAYRQAIRDAEDALDSAEKELDEVYAELDILTVPEDLPEN